MSHSTKRDGVSIFKFIFKLKWWLNSDVEDMPCLPDSGWKVLRLTCI